MTVGDMLGERSLMFGNALFVISALIAVLLTSSFQHYALYWIGLACLSALLVRGDSPLPRNLLTLAMLVYSGVLLINALMLSPTYEIKGIYFILFHLLAFLSFSRLSSTYTEPLVIVTLTVVAGLVIWGLVQHFFGTAILIPMGSRANAIFYTPNSFASFINLFLLPFAVLYLLKVSESRYLLPIILLLFAGLLATQSRGGYLALAGGAVFFSVWLRWHGRRIEPMREIRLLVGMSVIALAMFLFEQVISNSDLFISLRASRIALMVNEGDSVRLQLYELAWKLIRDAPWFGHGYYNFQYLLQQDQPDALLGRASKFVHNDYLQVWVETGIFGLLALLVLVGAIIRTVWMRYPDMPNHDQVRIIALGAGAAGIYAHALVDFPLYPPALATVSGALLGMLNRVTSDARNEPAMFGGLRASLGNKGFRPVIADRLLLIVLLLWMAQPMVAQILIQQGKMMLSNGNSASALRLFQYARATASYDPAFFHAEGKLWARAAIIDGNQELGAKADSLLAKGISIHPYEHRNRLQRLILHRDHPDVLEYPASNEQLENWAEDLLKRRPHDRGIQVHVVNTFVKLGLKDRVNQVVRRFRDEPGWGWDLVEQKNGMYRSIMKSYSNE